MKKEIFMLVGGVVVLILAFVFLGGENMFSKEKELSAINASELALKYIEDNFTQGMVDVEIADTSEESGVYKIDLSIEGDVFSSYISKDGKLFFPEGLVVAESIGNTQQYEQTMGGFRKIENEVCLEDGKPVVYSFTSSTCPYCELQRAVLDDIVAKFGDSIIFKDRVDSEEDIDILLEYGDGSVPMLVVGCNYFRIGANTDGTEERNSQDVDIVSAHICKVTDNQPSEVCDGLENLTNGII